MQKIVYYGKLKNSYFFSNYVFQTLVMKQTTVLAVLAEIGCCSGCCCGGGGCVERAHALDFVDEDEEVVGDGASKSVCKVDFLLEKSAEG